MVYFSLFLNNLSQFINIFTLLRQQLDFVLVLSIRSSQWIFLRLSSLCACTVIEGLSIILTFTINEYTIICCLLMMLMDFRCFFSTVWKCNICGREDTVRFEWMLTLILHDTSMSSRVFLYGTAAVRIYFQADVYLLFVSELICIYVRLILNRNSR